MQQKTINAKGLFKEFPWESSSLFKLRMNCTECGIRSSLSNATCHTTVSLFVVHWYLLTRIALLVDLYPKLHIAK
jgi:hypothetical protein